jgi:hypothetical protein
VPVEGGARAVDRTIPGSFGLVTELLVVLRPLSQHDLTLQVQAHGRGAAADGIGLQLLIQPHEVLLLESVCCFGLCHGDASIVGDGEYLPELRRYDVIRYGGRTAWC